MRRHAAGAPLIDSIKRGFVYSDGWVDDARLVVLNAMDAKERGAQILTRTKLVSAERRGDEWEARLQHADGSIRVVHARAIANAAGPWVGDVLKGALGRGAHHSVRLVKGSHIITRRLFDHDHAYIFQNPDKRIIFAIPYEHDFTLIGTTDVEYTNDPAKVAIDRDETQYLCDSINRYFKRKISPADVHWTYSGVRPLLEDENAANASAVTRDYRLELDDGAGAPLLSVFGGKITTFRKLAEEAGDMLCRALGRDAKMDGRRRAAGRRHREREVRRIRRYVRQTPCLAARRARPPLCPCIRHARGTRDRRREVARRSRHRNRTGHLRRRTALPARRRMGDLRAGRAVAPLEARPARRARHARRGDRRGRRVVRRRARAARLTGMQLQLLDRR